MREARISKRLVFPIIITILVQFHLPHLSLAAAYAAGIPAGEAFRIAVDFDKNRTIPYRESVELTDKKDERLPARLLGLSEKTGSGTNSLRKLSQTPFSQNRAGHTARIIITAYSSTKDQTDASPCVTANGYNVCKHNSENVIAANFLPFGTRVKIPELFGDKEFVVQDRMNRRYGQRVDIWMTSRQKAKTFGVKHATVVVVPKEQQHTPQPLATQIAANF